MGTTVQDLSDKIKSGPHWRITFRPTQYDKQRLPEDTEKTLAIVQCAQVRQLTAWSYPFVGLKLDTQEHPEKYIEAGIDADGHTEYWRLYYSSQFIHLFSVEEITNCDWRRRLRNTAAQSLLNLRIGKERIEQFSGFINIIEMLHKTSLILEFAARLSENGVYANDIEICIKISGIKGVALVAVPPKHLAGTYRAPNNEVSWQKTIPQQELLSGSSELALQATNHLYSQFGWNDVPSLKSDQEGFLSGKP